MVWGEEGEGLYVDCVVGSVEGEGRGGFEVVF